MVSRLPELAGAEACSAGTTRLQATFEHAPLGIVNLAPDGRFLIANIQFCDLLGFSMDELAGLRIGETLHPEDAPGVEGAITSLLEDVQPSVPHLGQRFVKKDRTLLPTFTSFSLARGADGQALHIIAVVEPVTAVTSLGPVTAHRPRMDNAVNHAELEQALLCALDREEFVLHYQPRVDLRSGSIVGVEALIRWQHPQRGLLAPPAFLGLANTTGLLVRIGAWVIRTACQQSKAWQQAGLRPVRMAVNLSEHEFLQPELPQSIASILADTGLDPQLLEFELTETAVMENVAQTVERLQALKRLGVQLSIDDFGTGYSSLSHLKRFPVDMLKIDRSFISGITHADSDSAIPAAIIDMAHRLGIGVVAVGIETESQCEFMSRNLCDEIQGHWFCKPLPAAHVEALLRQGKCLPAHLQRQQKPARVLLLVDDEPNVIAAVKRLLRVDGYHMLTANSGEEGLRIMASTKVDVILSDQRMPGMTGVNFLRTVKMLYPETVRIVLSGFTELQSVTDAVNEGAIYKFLTKPWDDGQLREHIGEAFRHKGMADENRFLAQAVRTANQGLARAIRQLEEVLEQQKQQIMRDEITLDIVREALQHVPLPMIGLDDDTMIAFANVAAQHLFSGAGPILGSDAQQIMPEVLLALQQVAEGERTAANLAGRRFDIVYRSMGNGTASRGKLVTLTPPELSILLERDNATDGASGAAT